MKIFLLLYLIAIQLVYAQKKEKIDFENNLLSAPFFDYSNVDKTRVFAKKFSTFETFKPYKKYSYENKLEYHHLHSNRNFTLLKNDINSKKHNILPNQYTAHSKIKPLFPKSRYEFYSSSKCENCCKTNTCKNVQNFVIENYGIVLFAKTLLESFQ